MPTRPVSLLESMNSEIVPDSARPNLGPVAVSRRSRHRCFGLVGMQCPRSLRPLILAWLGSLRLGVRVEG